MTFFRICSRFLIIAGLVAGAPLAALAGQVAEKELLLRNTLGVSRTGEVVTITLKELGVTADQEKGVRDVEVVDEAGTSYLSQLDDFARFPGFSSEVAFEADLKPYETRRVIVRLHDAGLDRKAQCTATSDGKTATVVTPFFTAPVRNGGRTGLWVEQPRLAQAKGKQESDAMDALLNEGPAQPAVKGSAGNAALQAPMREDGLPFCVQGFPAFDGKGVLTAWGGPVRAVVCLPDRGTWATGHSNTLCSSLQTAWFPRRGNVFFLDWRATFETPVPSGSFPFAGLRVNSADQPWDLVMGQDRLPPLVAPVVIPLAKTGKTPYLEGYQKATFNDSWAQAVCAKGWVAVVVDDVNSRFGSATNWDTGRVRLNCNMGYSDPGPFDHSLLPSVRLPGCPAGDARIRVMVPFGGAGDPLPVLRAAGRAFAYRWRTEPVVADGLASLKPAYAAFTSPLAQPVRETAAVPEPDWARIRALAAGKSVVVVTPDVPAPDRSALWKDLAERFGGTWRPSRGFLQFFNVTCQGRRDKSLLTVVAGEPGTNPLLNQLNDRLHVVSPYPLAADKPVVAFFDETDDEGPLLVVAGNTGAATGKAVETVLKALGDRPAAPAVTLAPVDWAARMPYPWSGLKPHVGAFRTVAYRNGRADFLLLARAHERVEGLAFEGPSGAACRFVEFRFSSTNVEMRVVPLHDAAAADMPKTLEANGLAAIWVSLPVPSNAPAGPLKAQARLAYAGGSCPVELEAEVLPVALADKPALGFYPLGFDADAVRFYYGWDEETYLRKLPDLLRQAKSFGVNTYTLDVTGMKLAADSQGRVTVDAAGLKRELDAVRSAGSVDVLFADSFNHLWSKTVLSQVMKARKLADDFEAFEVAIPEIRKALRELGLEDQLVCRHGDEIGDYENWRAKSELYQRCGARMTVAINGYGVNNRRLGVGVMGFWIPLYNFYLNRWGKPIADDDAENFSKTFRDQRQAAGEPVWPYVCGPGPYAWSPRPRSQARFLMLDTYMKGADGLTYYGGMVWSQALDPAFRKSVLADLMDMDATFTTLFYPDAEHGTLLPSLRAGSFRLGLEDATAVKALRERAKAKGKAEAVEAELQKAYAVLTMDSAQEDFDAFRRTLARLWTGLPD